MRREAARTLYTLSTIYQQKVSQSDYEIIVIDNGSSLALDQANVEAIGPNFEYHYFETDSKSPVDALNHGVGIAKGTYIGCIVDGARMVTPMILYYSLLACNSSKNPYVTALAWHLGPKEQNYSILGGYNQETEDQLLDTIDWQNDGYQLFEISAQASSSSMGFLGGLPYESSFFVMEKSAFLELGGFDSRFQSSGGGLVNHAFLNKVIESKKFNVTVLLGEGSFHQFHGGVATNVEMENHPIETFKNEYKEIYGVDYVYKQDQADFNINYIGTMPKSALKFISKNAKT